MRRMPHGSDPPATTCVCHASASAAAAAFAFSLWVSVLVWRAHWALSKYGAPLCPHASQNLGNAIAMRQANRLTTNKAVANKCYG